ncbi:MAG: hypothetical protein WBA98_01945 [Gordonia sp. (in: high G+C Gram-positive bacteria)]|uniref:hypothetical protein n=1 Tax=Gordonia sp. (in: high G+C Gram-positive bacteria) TaxID=84139 RepID=UPI003C71E2E0
MSETRWWKYVERLIGDDTAQDAARRAGFDKSAFTRWKKGAGVGPEFVVKLARAYQANVLEALVEAEFISETEAKLREISLGRRELIESLTDEEIAAEVLARLNLARRTDTTLGDGYRAAKSVSVDELARRRNEMSGLPDTFAAHHGEKGVPDVISDGEGPQVGPDDGGDFDPA